MQMTTYIALLKYFHRVSKEDTNKELVYYIPTYILCV